MATDSAEPYEANGAKDINGTNGESTRSYSMLDETQRTLSTLLSLAKDQIPSECLPYVANVDFKTTNDGTPYFPTPFKQTEAISALKALEAAMAGLIADTQEGSENGKKGQRKMTVDLERATCFMFSAYLCTVRGLNKADPDVKSCLKDTDLNKAQSILYRRLSANLYETKNPGEYFHLHGSLEATTALNMVGLPGHRPDMTDYRECIDLIESHVRRFTATELEELNAANRQAGVTCLKWEEFKESEHGRALLSEPPFRLTPLELSTPPTPIAPSPGNPYSNASSAPQVLRGILVLELCRIIAGPSIGRGLAEHGASVLKITSPNLPDVPFFQVDGNLGKHAADLDLRDGRDRAAFDRLLRRADVLLDGYRPGALERLGYGPEALARLARARGRGYVYVAENCFGQVGPWRGRPGWQQIADCATGVAWAQGAGFMGLDEPVIPPFPMSDYGTGCMGTVAAMVGLWRRAREGGSWWAGVSLCQYDAFLMGLGLHADEVRERLRERFEGEEGFFGLRHADSVDEVGKRALRAMRRVAPHLFEGDEVDEEGRVVRKGVMQRSYSRGFEGAVTFVRPAVSVQGVWNGWVRNSRPNGFDGAAWEGWEVDRDMLDG
ncbi:CoA-transferase family III domain-containing protein [Lineolata rhizophorae]|uniref:CoA-transferase family III domain-containing protein n=1 Tax=Lineolata rhizophorae TaxID=578093 RepID=A0A6A6NVP3_9PEZI|nr:CoA-transferase family III domain-containing protein [Lineolata rhizophorae]